MIKVNALDEFDLSFYNLNMWHLCMIPFYYLPLLSPIHMYTNAKMISVETIPGMIGIQENSGGG
jgi:hypothetical protein